MYSARCTKWQGLYSTNAVHIQPLSVYNIRGVYLGGLKAVSYAVYFLVLHRWNSVCSVYNMPLFKTCAVYARLFNEIVYTRCSCTSALWFLRSASFDDRCMYVVYIRRSKQKPLLCTVYLCPTLRRFSIVNSYDETLSVKLWIMDTAQGIEAFVMGTFRCKI